MKLTYTGGMDSVSLVFPHRSIIVERGDTIDFSAEEAAALKSHPDWSPVKPPAKSATNAKSESKED